MFIPLIVALAIAVSGSVGIYAANNSLPGDALYPVKIHVNEGFEHMGAIGAEAEAKLSAELIARRAEEARMLQSQGKLDAEARATLASEMKSEMNNWHENTNKLSTNGDAAIKSQMESTVTTYGQTYADVFQTLNVSLQSDASASVNGSTNTNTTNESINGAVNSSADAGIYVNGSASQTSSSTGSSGSATGVIKSTTEGTVNLGH